MSYRRVIRVSLTILGVLIYLSFNPLSNALSQEKDWTKENYVPVPRSEVAGAVLNGKLYIIGGFDKNGQSTSTVYVYDPHLDKWDSVAPLPRPLDHTAAASHDGKLYVVGGGNTAENGFSNKLFIYRPNTNDWIQGADLPAARGALTSNFINGTLYAIGGVDVSGVSNDNLAYDPLTNTWTEKASMPTPREHLSSAIIDGKLLALGGRQTDNDSPKVDLNSNEMYNPLNDSWTIMEPMPTKRSGIAAAVSPIDGNIYVFGGENPFRDDGPTKTFDVVEKYDPKTNSWTVEKPMPTPRHGLAAVSFDNKIFVIAGGSKPGLSVSDVNEVLLLNSSRTT